MSVISPEFYFLNKFPIWIYYLSRETAQMSLHFTYVISVMEDLKYIESNFSQAMFLLFLMEKTLLQLNLGFIKN